LFVRDGRVSVSARLPNGLYAEPILAGAGVTLGEAGWPKVRTPPQRTWATSGAVGWLLPKERFAEASERMPSLTGALETLGTLRRGLANAVAASKRLPMLAGASTPVLAGIVMGSEVVKVLKGESVLVAERPDAPSPTHGMYLLVSGGLRALTPDGRHVSTITPGNAFGGMAHGGLRYEPEDVVAMTDSVAIRIPFKLLRGALWASPTLRAGASTALALAEVLQEVVEVLLFVGDPGFPMARIVDLVGQTLVRDFDDRVAVLTLVPKSGVSKPVVQGDDKVWRGTLAFDPEAPPDAAMLSALKAKGKLEYILLEVSGLPPEQLGALRRSVSRAVVLSEQAWTAPPFPLGPGRVNWCVQVGKACDLSDPPYPPTTVRVRFDFARVSKSRTLDDLTPADRARFSRWARDLTERRVGLALGGGGAWGFAHTTLIREIHKAGIPIDMVSGSSFGALCGAFWCATGDPSFQALKAFAPGAQLATRLAFFSSLFLEQRVDAALCRATGSSRPLRLEHLEVPLYPVATNIAAGCEAVLGLGTVGYGVRCSSSFPGIITPTTGSGFRYVDGGIVRNVPTTPLVNQGANLLVASNIVASPAFQASLNPMFKGKVGRVLHEFNPLMRAVDTMRSALILMHAAGEATAMDADVQFASDPIGNSPVMLTAGAEIAELAQDEVDEIMPLIQMRWDALRARDP